jgi:hypothetical protein
MSQKVGRRRKAQLRLITGRKEAANRVRRLKQKVATLNGLNWRQRAFVREKIFGLTDKDAALIAGYSPSVAENTKQKIWTKAGVREEYERLQRSIVAAVAQEISPRLLDYSSGSAAQSEADALSPDAEE